MLVLYFEVTPKPGHMDHYFKRAAALKLIVELSGGLVFLDRYMSLLRPDTVLSYQLWEDGASLERWRNNAKHHLAQRAGRDVHFADYRLRIAQIVQSLDRDPGTAESGLKEFPANEMDGTEARFMASVESIGEPFPRGEAFKSVNRDETFVSVLHVANDGEGREIMRDADAQAHVTGARLCLISRDYGMRDRREAPQSFDAAETSADA